MKKEFSQDLPNHELAGILIYLNKTCYNGLFRVNSKSEFNVPYGKYVNPLIVDVDTLKACSAVLKQGHELVAHSFKQTPIVQHAFYYLDPPYHQTYSSYDNNGFGDSDHKELAEMCHAIDAKGSGFVLSNSDSDLIRRLYSRYSIQSINNRRSISCKGSGRHRQTELIITNVSR